MKNRIQIIDNKIYYDMECVAMMNDLNYGSKYLEFKDLLKGLNEGSFDDGYLKGYQEGKRSANDESY